MKHLALLLALALPVFGQTFGEITGNVTDPTGAAIPGAEVVTTNIATGQERRVTTNATGNYTVPFLVPGRYKIEARSGGFKSAVEPERILQVGDVARVDFALEVGAVTESIEVSASAQMLQTSSTSTGTVIEQQRIVELPLNGRNYLQLVKLSPNVTAEMGAGGQASSRQGGDRPNQALSIAGQRQEYNRYTLDGIENTDPNFNTFVVRPSVDALQEFKVQTGVYSAEFGTQVSQINVTTKSGTNEYHGTVFEFLRHDKIQARPWNRPGEKNPYRRNQFGFTVAGPIFKNKLFWMANYEGLRRRQSGVQRVTVADQAMRAGDFSGPRHLPIYDPSTIREVGDGTYTADPFPGQQIPASRFKQPFLQLFDFYPEPNVAGAVTGVDPYNYVRNSPDPLDQDGFTTRIDFQESANSQWFGRFSWGEETLLDGQNFEFRDLRTLTKTWQAMLSNVRTVSPTMVNELRLGVNLFDNDQLTRFNGERDVTSELDIPGLVPPIEAAWGTPEVGFTGNNIVSGWGEQTGGPFINRNRTYQILDNFSWVHGNHTIKFGTELTQRRFNQIGNQFPRGFFQHPSQYTAHPQMQDTTGEGFATGLLGWISEATRALGIANLQFRSTALNFYAEDSWKITPTLTLNLGLRYEYTQPWHDRYRGMWNVKMYCNGVDDTGIDEDCRPPTVVRPGPGDFNEGQSVHLADNVPKETGDDALYGRGTVKPDKNDFAPRIGIAWQPSNRWTVRTGFGIYYTQDSGNPVFDMGRNLGFRQSARSLDVFPTSNYDSPWANIAAGGATCEGWDGPCVAGLYTFANHVDRKTPMIMQYMLNVQRQLTDSLMIEAGYSGNQGRNLQRMYGWNTPLERNGPLDQTSTDDRRPWGADKYARIQTIGGGVNSNYNALSFKVQQRFTKGLTYLIGYTWGRAIDSGTGIRTRSGDPLFPASSYDFSWERGLSQVHTKHRFTASVLYDIPLRFQNRVAEATIGGWQTGSIVTLSTGTPFTVGGCGDLNGNAQDNRGDATGISMFPDNPTAQEYFRRDNDFSDGSYAAAVSCNVPDDQGFNQLTYRQGNINRNAGLSPGVVNWDFSLMKNFKITERFNLEFRFESFNFPNHPNWNTPSTNRASTNYGVVTSARTMRTNQFGLKFSF